MEKKINLELNSYHAGNLRWLLRIIYGTDRAYNAAVKDILPVKAEGLNTGDWNGEVLWNLEQAMIDADMPPCANAQSPWPLEGWHGCFGKEKINGQSMKHLILEGSDLIGKSTAFKMLEGMLPIQDRYMPFTEAILPTHIDCEALDKAVATVAASTSPPEGLCPLIVILAIRNDKTLMDRLALRDKPDEYDLKCVDYNRQYLRAAEYLFDRKNVVLIEVDGLSKFQKCARIVEEYLKYINPGVAPYSVPPK